MIDPHVHLRDWAQAEKETLDHGLSLAWRLGISAVFEMPNTDPPLTSRDTVRRRIAEADAVRERRGIPIFHGLYAGITPDPRQLEEIVRLHQDLFPRVVGFKLFAGHSTGHMGVVSREEQALVWNTLAALDYRGVVAVHAETEDVLRPDLWDPAHPRSHGAARPVAAEIHSVRQQIELATAAGFRGAIHICHVTTPAVLDIIAEAHAGSDTDPDARADISASTDAGPGFSVRGGVTPHHALLSEELADRSPVPEWKVNPPLRDRETQTALLRRLESGGAGWIESDHAPHTWADKRAGASGIPGLHAFRFLRDLLADRCGREFAEHLSHGAVLAAFGIPESTIPRNPAADARWSFRDAADEYPWDPYRFLSIRA